VVVVSALGLGLAVRAFIRGPWEWLVAFSKTRFGRLLLGGLLVALAIVVAFLLGQRSGVAREKGDEAKRRAAAVKVVTKVATEGRKISADVSTHLERRKVEIRTVTQTLTKEVPVYVTLESDRACVVPDGFVRLHDAAAHGSAVPAAPGGSVETASGVPLSAVAETMVANYGVALEWREEALAWRTWYARQADLWSKNIKTPDPEP
jgi:hypothetical protein